MRSIFKMPSDDLAGAAVRRVPLPIKRRKNMKKTRRMLALLMASMLVLGGCKGNSGTPSAGQSGSQNTTAAESGGNNETKADGAPAGSGGETVITLAMAGGWDSLCPLASTANYSDTVCNTIFENLFEADGKGDYIGRLGESYELADDNMSMIVHLRQGAVWHDGEPFDADDVMFSVGLVTDGSYTTSRRLFFQTVDGCSSSGVELSQDSAHVEKIDDYTVKFYYQRPMSAAAMLAPVSSFFIMPEHILADADPAVILENDFWVAPVGTGPFTYESQIPGESLTVKAFDNYYLGRPKFDKLVIKVITPANLVTSMMAGEVDIIPGTLAAINDSDYEMASTIDGYTVQSLEGTSSQYLVVNNKTFPSVKVRQALAMLLDKEKMIQAGCYGNAKLLYTNYAEKNIYYDSAVVEELGYTFDPDTAYQMLVEEGFDFDRTYVACINDLAVRQSIMTVMQETWAKYGMKLEIKTLDTQTCISEIREGNCDFWINGGASADVSNLQLTFIDWCTVNEDGTYAPFNLAKIDDPTLMNLVQDLSGATEEDELRRLTSEIQRYILTNHNYIYIISPNINVAINNRVSGIDEDQMLGLTFNYCDWEVK